MAYENLKEQLAAAIYANGRQEIDAPDVRTILATMIDELGEGFRIIGVATPTTTPTQTDKSVAYIAATAGTYVGFGGIVLAAGQSALFVNTDGVWQSRILGLMPGTAGAVSSDLLANSAVTSAKVADNAITTAKVADGSINTAKIADNATTTAKLADSAITTAKIADGAVESAKIGSNAVTTPKIMDSNVTSDKLASGSVTTAKIANYAVTRDKVADAAISAVKIDVNAVTTEKIANGSVATAKLADSAVESSKIAANAVSSEKIVDAAVTHAKLANNAVESDNIKNDAVGTAKIANSSVTAGKIADDAVTGDKVADNAIGTSNIVNGSVTVDKLAVNSVTSEKVAAGAITSTKLAANAVTASNIASGAVSLEKLGEDVTETFDDLYLTKVDKVEGKGLSTNDFTDAERTKLSDLPTNDVLNDTFAKKDGFYETLGAGYSRSLLGTGASVPATITRRPAGGTADIASGVATLKDIKGNTIVWNQMFNLVESKTVNGVSFTNENGLVKIQGTATSSGGRLNTLISSQFDVFAGRKYLFVCPNHRGSSITFFLNKSDSTILIQRSTTSIVTFVSDTHIATFGLNTDNEAEYDSEGVLALIDLTKMFGAGNEPSSLDDERIKWLMSLSVPYNAGELLSLTAENLVTEGFNAFDKTTGKARVLALTPSAGQAGSYQIVGAYTSITQDGEAVTPDTNGFFTPKSGELVVVGGDDTTCIHIVHSGSRNGDYEPHWQESKNLNLTTLKGKLNGQGESVTIFPQGMRSAGSAADELNGNEAIVRVGAVDLGTLNWTYYNDHQKPFMASVPLCVSKTSDMSPLLCTLYTAEDASVSRVVALQPNKTMLLVGSSIIIKDEAYTDAATFKAAMSGVMLYYELATPLTYTLDEPLVLVYRVDDYGTERIEPLEDEQGNPATAPLKANIVYGPNVQDAIRRMPTLYLSIADYKAGIGNLATALGTSLDKTIAVEWGGENDSVPTFTITDNA